MTDSPSGTEGNVFLVPSDPENHDRTVASTVALRDYPDRPEPLASLEEARLWGVLDGKRNVQTFERLEPGDLLLFYHDGTYVGVGRVGVTFEDEAGWASETLWEDAAIEHVFTVVDFVPLEVDRAAVNRLFDYGPTYAPNGLLRVAPDRVTARLPAIELALKRFDERRS